MGVTVPHRYARGDTVRPANSRPGSGYGRPAGCPRPLMKVETAQLPEPAWFLDEALAPVNRELQGLGLVWTRQTDV